MIKIFSAIISVIWLGSFYGMGPVPMDPAEFNLYLDDVDNTVVLEIPPSTGWSAHKSALTPKGYEVSELLDYLENEYDICVDYTNITQIPTTRYTDIEPQETPALLSGVLIFNMFHSQYKFVTTDYKGSVHRPGYVVGWGGGNMTLNTIPCQ